jgi:hypothetical protein
MGNFLPQKSLEVGGRCFCIFIRVKTAFGQKHLGRLSLLVGFWFLQKQKQVQKPNQRHSTHGMARGGGPGIARCTLIRL